MVDLPAPDSPMSPITSPRLQLQRHVIDEDRPLAGVGAHRDAHAANVEDDGIVLGSEKRPGAASLMRLLPGLWSESRASNRR